MNIKIEKGAKVQITDKPIYNIYGDVVQQKTVLPSTTEGANTTEENPQSGENPIRPSNIRRKKQSPTKTSQDYSRYSFRLNVDKCKLEKLYSLLSEKDKTGRCFIDGNLINHNDAQKALGYERKDEFEKFVKDIDPEHIDIAILTIDKALFNMVFSGQDTDVRIVWRANANELMYLIDTMHKTDVMVKENGEYVVKKLLEWASGGPRIWQLTRSRFMNGKARKVVDERTGKPTQVDEPIEFDEGAFDAHNYPKNTTRLDDIIDSIASNRVKSIHEELQDDFNRKANHRKENKNSLGNLRSDGNFRDTNHKAKE